MSEISPAFRGLAAFNQFLLYKLVWSDATSKFNKIPISPITGVAYPKKSDWQKDPSQTVDYQTASNKLATLDDSFGLAFLFTVNDPFFFVDLDNCLLPDGSGWSQTAMDILGMLPGAAVEISQSKTGLHIFGSGICPEHACKNMLLGLELYTESRFVALTEFRTQGDCLVDLSANLPALVDRYFPKSTSGGGEQVGWTTEPVENWKGLEDDDELISKAIGTQSGASIFGGRASFKALWEADDDILGQSYPDINQGRTFDASIADAALAQHLAFWTGNNCERILSLMQRSALVREKWEREDYLEMTILNAVSRQTVFHGMRSTEATDKYGAGKLRASSDAQRQFAESVREQKLSTATEEEAKALSGTTGANTQAKFWLNNRDMTPAELAKMVQPISTSSPTFKSTAEIVTGYQYLNATLQLEHFAGCAYVQDQHAIFTPTGVMLKSEQFNASFGGYVFQLDETGDKTTRKAWECFTESQVIRFPKAESTCFRPEVAPGAIVQEEGRLLVNTYIPIDTPKIQGDVSPFLNHLQKILPNTKDQAIILAYMAACIQHKGVKFQWAPLIQGVEGNGKTLLTRCVAFAVGNRYTHMPPANEISEKFNEWLFGKLFIGIEDVFVPEHKREVIEILKPMITNDRLAMRAMQRSQVMGDNRANFMLNANYKDAIRKTRNDRRFSLFFCAQQEFSDIAKDGMDGDYFPKLYHWLREEGGYATVAYFLTNYQIPVELNPAIQSHRAPETSSTHEAISESLGSIEQEILEAIDEDRPGFAGGWISSVAIDRLLNVMRASRSIPQNKRRELLQGLGYDWHPALPRGRVNNPIPMDDMKKPRLFIKKDHIACNLQSPVEVAKAYIEAQNASISNTDISKGKEVFG